jgi:TonB family protein
MAMMRGGAMKVIVLVVAVTCLIPSSTFAGAPQSVAGTYQPGNGVSWPVLATQVKPQYTLAAKAARIEGTVTLECVVGVDGSVGEVRVTKPLSSALDAEAVKALKQWRFKPGTKDGKPVRVRVSVEISFQLATGSGQPLFPLRPLGSAGSPLAAKADEGPIYVPGKGVVPPVVVKEAKPQYTPAAKAAGIEGMVTLECVVLIDGSVGEVRVTKPLDESLDEEAIKAIRQWRFLPGTKDGKPVQVRVDIEMTFSLR